MDKIGIKLANSEFYPILDHGRPARKRLVVTTVNDGQKSVQIDLYRGEGPMIEGAAYVGSLVVEDIPSLKAGEPDVRLDLELDENDMLRCTAVEAETGVTQSIRVSLESLGEENSYEIPDFDLGEEETDDLPLEATSPEEGAGLLASAEELRERETRPSALPIILVIVLILLAGLSLIWFFALRPATEVSSRSAPPSRATSAPANPAPSPAAQTPAAAATTPAPATPAAQAATVPEPAAAAPTTTATAKPTAATPAASGGKPKTTATATATATAAQAGTRYRIKWGDTLWDLAWAYYRNPWLYTRIAKANHIRNPDRIISGTWILIPPR